MIRKSMRQVTAELAEFEAKRTNHTLNLAQDAGKINRT